MFVLGVEGSEKKCGPTPPRIISGTALSNEVGRTVQQLEIRNPLKNRLGNLKFSNLV